MKKNKKQKMTKWEKQMERLLIAYKKHWDALGRPVKGRR
jgi:hypothetical protein